MQIYTVGGALRDELLGLPVKDRDYVVVGATPEAMVALGYRPVGKDFPVFLHPHTHEEYALARTERKTARGYRGFQVYSSPEVTLEEDLQRRDLTINAMARDAAGVLIDPHGGAADLRAGVLRHVSEAFVEDPVRILRVARFAARFGFTVAPKTQALMVEMVRNGEVDALVPERVWQELSRGLMAARPSRMFAVLRDCGALARCLPEVDALFGVPQPAAHHPEIDTGTHVMMALDLAADRGEALDVRYAVLAHDLGKATTPVELLPGHAGHEARSVERAERVSERLRAPAACRELGTLVARYHTHVHRALELRPATLLDVLERSDAFRRAERFEAMLRACECDARGRLGFETRPYPQADRMRAGASAARAVDAGALAREGGGTEAVRERIRLARIASIRRVTGDAP